MSSIAKEISADTLANQAIMERRQSSRTILLVEGGTDARYFRRFVERDSVSLTICHDRERVILTIGVLRARGETGILGIVDSDFSFFRAQDQADDDDDIIKTDENDLETTILPAVYEKILDEFGTEQKVNVAREKAQSPIQRVFTEAAKIGALRALSARDGLNLRFANMNFQFVSNASFEIDKLSTVEEVFRKSGVELDKDEVMEKLAAIVDGTEPIKLCSGHDCVRIFGRAIRREFGSDSRFDKSDRDKNDLYAILRVSHETQDFQATTIYSEIRAWENRNPSWKVLS